MPCSALRWSCRASCSFSSASTPAAGSCTARPRSRTSSGPPAALYGVLVFPFIWGLTEQMTYNGYLLPRFQVLCRRTSVAIAVVASAWSLQHAFMPLTFDAKFMAFRLLASVPFSVFETLLYLRLRRIVPFVIAHALLDGATVLIPL